MASNTLAPGVHTFQAGQNTLSYHITPSTSTTPRLCVQQAIAWGPGRGFYVKTLAPLLRPHFTVLDFSPRGSDESSRPKDASGNVDPSLMNCTATTEDLEALRVHLGIEAFDILGGHSQAGVPVLLYAALYPTRVENLVAIGPYLLNYDHTPTFAKYAALRADKPQWKNSYEAWARFRDSPPDTDEEFRAIFAELVPSYLVDPERDAETVTRALLYPKPPDIWCYKTMTPNYATDEHANDMVELMGKVQARVLFEHGEHDMVCSADGVRTVAEKMRNGKAGEVKVDMLEIGHFPWIEAKEEFLKGVLEFLDVKSG